MTTTITLTDSEITTLKAMETQAKAKTIGYWEIYKWLGDKLVTQGVVPDIARIGQKDAAAVEVDSTVTPLLSAYTIAAVNGHSLGGYLASAFTRLFGASVGEVNTFNSAGFSDAAGSNIGSEFNKIETLLGTSALGMGSLDAVGLKQTNYRAGNAANDAVWMAAA